MPSATNAAPNQKLALQISPTMLIGLGGTGKDVLLRIRRMFFERFGRKEDGTLGFPVIGYLALDTDPGALDHLERARVSASTSSATSCSIGAALPRHSTALSSRGNWKSIFAAARAPTPTSSAGCCPN